MLNWFEIFESWNTVWKLNPKVYKSWKIFKWKPVGNVKQHCSMLLGKQWSCVVSY